MSIKTWEDEFIGDLSNVDKLDEIHAIGHSIHKWKGLKEKNLKRHNVSLIGNVLTDGNTRIVLDSRNCALCLLHEFCNDCSLYSSREGYDCTEKKKKEKISPYGSLLKNEDPKPMIKALKKALKMVKNVL